jgi:hypothetical protein
VEAALEGGHLDDGEVREALLEAYGRLAPEGSKRYPGCAVRTALLRGLGSRATAEDVPLLLAAIDTREHAPPSFQIEVAGRLRAAALVALAHVDDALAGFHACALLGDADPFSGDPALTAVRVLGSQDLLQPLYAYAWTHDSGEVVAECLRRLAPARWPIVSRLSGRFAETRDESVQLGLLDMLLEHPGRIHASEPLLAALVDAPLDVFRYGATTLVARREIELLDALRTRDLPRVQLEALEEASMLLPPR